MEDKQFFIERPSLKILDLWRQLQTSCWNEFFCFSLFLPFQISKEKEPLSSRLLLMACGGGAGRWAALGAAYLADPVGRGMRPGCCLWRLPPSVGSGGPRRGGEPGLSQEAGGPGVDLLGGKGGVGTARGRSCGSESWSPGRTCGSPPPSMGPDWLVQGLQGSSEPSCFSIFKLWFRAVRRKMLALTSGAGSPRPPATPARSVMRILGESPAGIRALQAGSGRRGYLRPVVRRLLWGP